MCPKETALNLKHLYSFLRGYHGRLKPKVRDVSIRNTPSLPRAGRKEYRKVVHKGKGPELS